MADFLNVEKLISLHESLNDKIRSFWLSLLGLSFFLPTFVLGRDDKSRILLPRWDELSLKKWQAPSRFETPKEMILLDPKEWVIIGYLPFAIILGVSLVFEYRRLTVIRARICHLATQSSEDGMLSQQCFGRDSGPIWYWSLAARVALYLVIVGFAINGLWNLCVVYPDSFLRGQ